MSLISKFKQAPNRMLTTRTGRGADGVGFAGFLVDKGERYGGSIAVGYLKARYRERFSWRGVGGDTILGVTGLVLGGVLNILSNGQSALAPHLERLGDVGLQAYALQKGAEWGADHAGYATKVVHQGAGPARQLSPQQVVGAIPAAKGGTVFLSDQDIANALAARR